MMKATKTSVGILFTDDSKPSLTYKLIGWWRIVDTNHNRNKIKLCGKTFLIANVHGSWLPIPDSLSASHDMYGLKAAPLGKVCYGIEGRFDKCFTKFSFNSGSSSPRWNLFSSVDLRMSTVYLIVSPRI